MHIQVIVIMIIKVVASYCAEIFSYYILFPGHGTNQKSCSTDNDASYIIYSELILNPAPETLILLKY